MGYEEAKMTALDWLNRVEEIRELSENEKESLSIPKSLDTWEISTEIRGVDHGFIDISFHLFLEPDYPYSFPRILLSPESFNLLKYLPHVNEERLVCMFQNDAQPSPEHPLEVLKETLKRSKRIIEDGIRGIGNELAFEEEFQAYWNDRYENESKVLESVVLLIEEQTPENDLTVLCFHENFNKVKYVVHRNEISAIRFKSFLDDYNHKYVEVHGVYLGELNNMRKPPFSKSNRDVFAIVSSLERDVQKAFRRFINHATYPKLVLFSKKISGETKYFGWLHKPIETNRNGFRPNALSTYKTMASFGNNALVQRINPESMNRQRLISRSAGVESNTKNRIYSVVGIGSVGSHLIHFLNATKSDEFRLVDYDTLKIENFGRHLLGFRHVNMHKSTAMKDHLRQTTPTQNITSREQSVVTLVNSQPEYLNESNYIFVALGEANTEKWLSDKMSSGVIIKPMIFLWVEPHLLGGHCIYLPPGDNIYADYFDENYQFKYNIIDKNEYLEQNSALSMKEAGCQSNYVPYSLNNVLSFLGHLNPFLTRMMNCKEMNSRSFTWIGDKDLGVSLNIKLSEHAQNVNSFTTRENPRP